MKRLFLFIIVVVLAVTSLAIHRTYLETTPPSTDWTNADVYLGKESKIEVSAMDEWQGLRSLEVVLIKDGNPISIFKEDYRKDKNPISSKNISIHFNARVIGIRDGPVTLRITAIDHSLWRWGKGNKSVVEYPVIIDTEPPLIEILSSQHRITQGGADMVIFRTSPDTDSTWVEVGDYSFPGYKGVLDDENIVVTLFSYPYDLPSGKALSILSRDRAGNTSQVNLNVAVRQKRYRKTTVNITDAFLQRKVPELSRISGIDEGGLLKTYLRINKDLRKESQDRIYQITARSAPESLWQGAFHQLSNSSVEANFADQRTYLYKGRVVDRQTHLGYDLSVTSQYPVEAANNGIVVFAGYLGIYGNSVIIDHGMGLFTIYSHMSSVSVREGDRVEKMAIIGRTGETGLAGGDHLHFSMMIHGVHVLPLEWWDSKWIKNRITLRLKAVKDYE